MAEVKVQVPTIPQVPLKINGSLFRPSAYKSSEVSLCDLIGDYLLPGRVNLDPPYQRKGCWNPEQKKTFIASTFNSMALPPLYLIKRKTGKSDKFIFDALDGKQRMTSLQEFVENKFKIDVKFFDESDPQMYSHAGQYSYQQIQEDDRFFDLRDKFRKHKIQVVEFAYMDTEDARKIFNALNNGSPLSTDEKIYSPNYMARVLLEELFNRVFGKVSALFSKSVQTGARFKNIRPIHELLVLTSGCKFDEEPMARSLHTKAMEQSANDLHNKLRDLAWDFESPVTDDLLEALNIKNSVKRLTILCDEMYEFLKDRPTVATGEGGKYRHTRTIIDPVGFLYSLGNKLDLEQMRSAKFATWLDSFDEEKGKRNFKMQTSDRKTMIGKFEIMNELWRKTYSEPKVGSITNQWL